MLAFNSLPRNMRAQYQQQKQEYIGDASHGGKKEPV
jgi:hypothetical protein